MLNPALNSTSTWQAASWLLPMSLLCSSSAFAQTSETQGSFIDGLLEKLGSSEQVDPDKLIDWGVLPGPFVNPEQGFGIGVAAVGLYTPYSWQPGDHYSTVTVSSYVSTSGSYGLGVENRSYLFDDTLRLLLEAWISHAPSEYWGVGHDNAQNSANKTQVDARRWQFHPKIAFEIAPNSYLKAGWNWQSYQSLDVEEATPVSQDLLAGTSSGYMLGLEYDSRDFEPNPGVGSYVSLEWNDYRTELGSDRNYQQISYNVRHYYAMSKATIIAGEIYGQSFDGDVPWYDYSLLGDDQRMRGYYQGQYRDKHQLAAQVELRHSFNSRHGMVAWLGAGNIAPDYSELFEQTWLPTVGVGYRFAFKARINVRVDLGVGKDSTGFYFQINEAF